MKKLLALTGLALSMGFSAIAPASAQSEVIVVEGHRVPAYTVWQARWDNGAFDRRHVILGRVLRFRPYRLTVARYDGVHQTIDLKNGTLIFPEGATPTRTQRVAVVGYYSEGTFIANRVILRN